jgi:hypothetical protein
VRSQTITDPGPPVTITITDRTAPMHTRDQGLPYGQATTPRSS